VFQVVRAASPVLLRVITLGAFLIYSTVSPVIKYLKNVAKLKSWEYYSGLRAVIPFYEEL
jgi:hypothetical protein